MSKKFSETVVHGRYSILDTLGGGGMARVYLARDGVLGREVALKVLREQYAEDAEFAERFKREARSAAALAHPNIVSVYDRGVAEDGTSYIAMEYVAGGSLRDLLSDGVLDESKAVSVALQIAAALEVAHGRGVIHRDIKPHNVLLTSSGDVKVADFGIARATAATSISRTDLVLGTASYMSPEQALGKSVDPRSDLYSLGVVLYELLTGERPFAADNPVAISMKHVNDTPRPPRELNPQISRDVDTVITKLLSKNPDDRYAGATELAEDLRRVRDGLPLLAAGPTNTATEPTRVAPQQTRRPIPPPTLRRRRRRSTPWIMLAIILLLAALGGFGWLLSEGGATVPDVTGMPQQEARQELRAENFRVNVRQQESSLEQAEIVLDQSPGGGNEAEENSRVTIEVGSGPAPVVVPEVVNMSLPEAEAALAAAGLAVGEVWEIQRSDVAPGVVLEQGYNAGAEIEPGAAVDLGVSVEPPPPEPAAPETPNQDEPPQNQGQEEQPGEELSEEQSKEQEELQKEQEKLQEEVQKRLEDALEDSQDGSDGEEEGREGGDG